MTKPVAVSPLDPASSKAIRRLCSMLSAIQPLPGEEIQRDVIFEALLRQTKPRDVAETLLFDDLVYSTNEITRLRKAKDSYLNACMQQAVHELAHERMPERDAHRVAEKYHDKLCADEVNGQLLRYGITTSVIRGRLIGMKLTTIVAFDHQISALEDRRNKTIAELDNHRHRQAGRREPPIIDADYKALRSTDHRPA